VVKDSVQELIVSLWKLEVNENDGLADFKSCLKELPKDSFVRMSVATFLIFRAYWYRSTDRGRRIFAEASEETLRTIGISMPVDKEKDLR
jgi:hypothetical protein